MFFMCVAFRRNFHMGMLPHMVSSRIDVKICISRDCWNTNNFEFVAARISVEWDMCLNFSMVHLHQAYGVVSHQ